MALVVGLMVVGITLMLWAGWHNLRERRLAMQAANANHVTLVRADAGRGAEAGEEGPHLQGKTAPAFTLVDLNGKKVSLADYKGKAVLVNFWATWCAPCKLEMPWFEELRGKYAGQGFEVLGIAEDEASKDRIAKTAQKAGVTYPILLTDGKVGPAYGGVDYLPLSFYVNANGVVVMETAGLASKDEVEADIRKAIASGTSMETSGSGAQAGGE